MISLIEIGYNEAIGLAKEYAKTKGPGTQAKPEQHAFFRRLLPIVKRTLEKCERENGFMLVHILSLWKHDMKYSKPILLVLKYSYYVH